MALALVQWDSTNNKFKAGGAAPDFRSGVSSVGSGVSSLSMTFSSALPNTNYAVIATWLNTVDSVPQQQPIVLTAFSVNGFTATWNAPTDSANYRISWIVMQQG